MRVTPALTNVWQDRSTLPEMEVSVVMSPQSTESYVAGSAAFGLLDEKSGQAMTSSSTRGGGGAGSGWSLLGVYSTDPCALGSALGRPDFFLSVARRGCGII